MLKLIDIDSSFFGDEPNVTILNLGTKRGLVKKAADDRISNFANTITPAANKIYVHILAMGAGEFFGANRNADYFPEHNLIDYYKTFETSPAHIFKHHINKDPSIAMGQVVFAVYNERMHRVEVVAWVDKVKGWDYVQKIEQGEFPATSMACHTPYDVCSICGNKARTRGEYCSHLREELGKVYPDGRKVMALNVGPLKFFDMSMVFRPADVTSGVLQKLASAQPCVSSAELAEDHELQEKKASFKKLSELIKEVEGQTVASSDSLKTLLNRVKDPDNEIINFLVHYDIDDILHALAELGISPSVGFFAKLIGQKLTGEPVDGIETLVNGIIKGEPEALNIPELPEKPGEHFVKSALLSRLVPFTKQSSLYPDSLVSNIVSTPAGMVADGGNIGYIGNGPHVQEDPVQAYKRLKVLSQPQEGPGLLNTLVLVAGTAIAAKWLLSRMIDRKMQEVVSEQNPHTKIVLVKSSQEAISTRQLAKASLLRSLNGI